MNALLDPLLGNNAQTLAFFEILRNQGIRHLVHRYHISPKLADEAVEALIDQIFEGRVFGFVAPVGGEIQAYTTALHHYLVYQILPKRAVDLIRSGQQKFTVSSGALADQFQMTEQDVLDLLGCFDVQTQACEHIEQQQLLSKLQECLAGLTDKLRAIAQGILADYTFEQIAATERISVGTVKSRSFEMYKKLRMCMQVTTIVK